MQKIKQRDVCGCVWVNFVWTEKCPKHEAEYVLAHEQSLSEHEKAMLEKDSAYKRFNKDT